MTGNDTSKLEQGRMDRRGIFRGAAMLGATGLLAPVGPFQALAAEPPPQSPKAAKTLSDQTQRILHWTGPAPADWVVPRTDVDQNVVVVGGGQSGVSISYWLGRKGIGELGQTRRGAFDKLRLSGLCSFDPSPLRLSSSKPA